MFLTLFINYKRVLLYIFVAICYGRTLLNNACNEPYAYDRIVYRGGEIRNSGGGTCSSPNYCTECENGFYQNGGRCLSTLQ